MQIFFQSPEKYQILTPSKESRPFVTLGLVTLLQLRLKKFERKNSWYLLGHMPKVYRIDIFGAFWQISPQKGLSNTIQICWP